MKGDTHKIKCELGNKNRSTYGGVGLRDFAGGRRLSGDRDLERDLERERLLDLDLERLLLLQEKVVKTVSTILCNWGFLKNCLNVKADIFTIPGARSGVGARTGAGSGSGSGARGFGRPGAGARGGSSSAARPTAGGTSSGAATKQIN